MTKFFFVLLAVVFLLKIQGEAAVVSKDGSGDLTSLSSAVVAKDGSGDFTSLSSAVDAAAVDAVVAKDGSGDFTSLSSAVAKDGSGDFTSLSSALDAAAVDAVVAKDGSGDFTSLSSAVDAAPRRSMRRHVLRLAKGVYDEVVRVPEDVWNLTVFGDGMGVTVVTGSRAVDDGYAMPDTATVGVDGPGFIAHDLTIQNTAGSAKQQALALRSRSFRSVVYRVSLEAHQDTLYAQDNYQFYHACKISGTVDFIFGDATAVFQSCLMVARVPHPGQQNVITAQGRNQASRASGFVFQFCNITGVPLLRKKAVETYLGRPWKAYSRVVFIECFIDSLVDRRGYLPWNSSSMGLDTLFYGEFNNSGPGADVEGRVNWPGFHAITAAEAANFTVASFLDGQSWLPGTGVEFTPGL